MLSWCSVFGYSITITHLISSSVLDSTVSLSLSHLWIEMLSKLFSLWLYSNTFTHPSVEVLLKGISDTSFCVSLTLQSLTTVSQLLTCLCVALTYGGGWVRQRCRLSCITGVSNWNWLTVGQGLLSLQQVRVEEEGFYFFCFFTFIHFPLSPLSLSFIFSTFSLISLLPFSGRQHEMTHKGWHVVKPQHNQNALTCVLKYCLRVCVSLSLSSLTAVSPLLTYLCVEILS